MGTVKRTPGSEPISQAKQLANELYYLQLKRAEIDKRITGLREAILAELQPTKTSEHDIFTEVCHCHITNKVTPTTIWKTVALAMKAPAALIAKNTKKIAKSYFTFKPTCSTIRAWIDIEEGKEK